jgi:hypothetical protein
MKNGSKEKSDGGMLDIAKDERKETGVTFIGRTRSDSHARFGHSRSSRANRRARIARSGTKHLSGKLTLLP